MKSYVNLGIAALLPVAAAVILWLLDNKTAFKRLNFWVKQVIFGLVFGGIAVIGTEWGIPIHGAQVNCRDAAVMTAGLLFGGPAGIIAGLIGGIERWFAVYWGVGTFTRMACSISTIAAGIYAALLRKYMFEKKTPGVFLALAVGIVMEVFHMTMIFFTNMSDLDKVMEVEKACTIPMVAANGLSLMLAVLAVTLLSGGFKKKQERDVSQTVQRWLLGTVLVALAATSVFIYTLQETSAQAQLDKLLNIALKETAADIEDASDENLLNLTKNIARLATKDNLEDLMERYDVSEINIINSEGIITNSTNPEYYTYKMASGEQSAEFLCLLGDQTEYVQEYGPISYNSNLSRKYAGVKYGDGFIQVGYDAEQFQKDIRSRIVGITKNRHVGETGFTLILDEKNQVVSAPDTLDSSLINTNVGVEEMPDVEKTYKTDVSGTSCYYRLQKSEGYSIVSVLPETEAMSNRDIVLLVNTFMEILVFAILFALIFRLVKRAVVKPVERIDETLEKITGGDLTEVVDERSSAEFSALSDGINSTVNSLKEHMEAEARKIQSELTMAKNIQASALPGVFPAFPKRKEFDIYASMDPAKEVGGDFYDFYFTHENNFNFIIADVSGKGIPAAMFMMRALTELKSLTQADLPIGEVFKRGNNALCEGNDAGMFVTAWQGGINLSDGTVKFANAGHNPPLVKHRDGAFEYLNFRSGFILAGMEEMNYKEGGLQLQPGDTVFLYTDGVTEATDNEKKLYGEERLLKILNSREFTDMKDLCNAVRKDVDLFVGDAPQFDDITMLAFRYFGRPEEPAILVENASIEDITRVTEFVEQELMKADCPMKVVFQLDVAIDEIFSNIVKYGYKDKTGDVEVKVIVKEEEREVYLRFCDHGMPYNPLTNVDPDVTLSAEEREIGGLGIYMVKKTMDDVKYKYEDGMNIFTIMKKME